MKTYSKLIKLIVRIAYNPDETILEKGPDDYTLKMSVKNQQTGDSVPFGFLRLEKDFIDFLKSGQAPASAPGLDDIIFYTKGSFVLNNTPENRKSLQAIDQNFEMAKKLNSNQLLPYLDSKRFNVAIDSSLKRKKSGDKVRDTVLEYYGYWLTSKQSAEKKRAEDSTKALNPAVAKRKIRIAKLLKLIKE